MELKQFLDSLTSQQLVDRLNLALDGATLGIWDWDLRDNSVQFDRRWCAMLGLEHAQTPMTLATWETRVHPDDIAQCYADIQAYLAGKTEYYENVHRMRHQNGEWIYILDRGRVSGWDEEGKPIRFTGTHFDCTTTERAKRVLEGQQELLAEMIRSLPTAVAMLDRDNRYVAASAEWVGLHELGGVEFLGHSDADVGRRLPEQWDDARRRAHGGETVGGDLDAVVVHGQTRFFRWSMRPWHRDGDVAGIVINADDITEFVRERETRERESRLSVLGLMAGGVAHEINSPLQSILVNTQVIREELDAAQPDLDAVRECSEDVGETTHHISRIVTALRRLSRDGSQDSLAEVRAANLAREVADLCTARFRTRGIEFRVEVACPEETSVRGRASDMGQILLNLLGNAFDAVEGSAQPQIRLEVHEAAGDVEFRVVDSGPGVPAELVSDLMTPFVTSKPVGKGSGLGLSISRSLAEGMGASLHFGAGAAETTFELRFRGAASSQEAC